MAVGVSNPPKRPPHRRTVSWLNKVEEEPSAMSDPIPIPSKSKPEAAQAGDESGLFKETSLGESASPPSGLLLGASPPRHNRDSSVSSTPGSPKLSRTASFSSASAYQDDEDHQIFPPVEKLTVFDFLENLALPQRLEKIQLSISAQTEKVRKSQQRLTSRGLNARDRVVDEWRRRVLTPDEQLEKYKKRMRQSVERLGKRWNDSKTITLREKISFIAGVMNIFISGYLIGALPELFHLWYGAQLVYFMPIRFYTYHKRGYHYFLADLCYFVNLLTTLSIWVFPNSKRLFISTYCLAYGNNAVAIAMWRNSLVFHSLDKVTSLFIHIMPCVTLHCLVHLLPEELQRARFPAVHTIRFSNPNSPEHYTLPQMMVWASLPYAVWQLTYHFMITVRKREKIAAGRPTSFTWLRRSYAPTILGKFVLSLPLNLQEPAFMMIQYVYALLTMVPCPLWFWNRWASAAFLMVVFIWSIYNGATYYIEFYGTRFQRELEQLKKEVAKWQASPDLKTPLLTPKTDPVSDKINPSKDEKAEQEGVGHLGEEPQPLSMGAAGAIDDVVPRKNSVDNIPLLDEKETK